MKTKIKFGTDGWRGVISDNFTFDNVGRVAEAFCKYLKTKNAGGKTVVTVGYDRRFLSREFALTFCGVVAEAGFDILLSADAVTSPCLAFTAASRKNSIGVMITASHNPYYFNGIKFKSSRGASLGKAETDVIENLISESGGGAKITSDISIRKNDFSENYLTKIKSFFDFDRKTSGRLNIGFNPMFGSAAKYLPRCVGSAAIVSEINSKHDPLFGGEAPEPIEKYLSYFKKFVVANRMDAGLAVDGDGDRIGVIDDTGRYLPPHIIFPLLLEYFLKHKKLKGRVVQGFALGYLSKRVAADYGVTITEVPVGFKFVAEEMEKGDCLIGAEESGGIGMGNFIDYIPERDGILASMFIIEMLLSTGKKLSALAETLQKKYGVSFYDRRDIKLNSPMESDEIYKNLKDNFTGKIAGLKVAKIDTLDGMKFVFNNDSWLLVRPSGTEPVIRIYCESPDKPTIDILINHIEKLLKT